MNTQRPGVSTRRERALAPGMLAVRDRLAALARRRPLVADAPLAALALLLSLPPFTSLPDNNKALALVLILATVCPLAWRRRAPFLVLLIMVVPAVGQLITRQQLTDFLAFLVIFYTIVVYSAPRLVWAAAALVELGALVGVVRLHGGGSRGTVGGHPVFGWALASGLIALAGLLGYYVRTNRRARAAALAERAERAERDREQRVQLAASAERARIAREMHDIVAHNIAVMIALAEGAAYTTKKDADQAVDLMSQVSMTGRTALTEMRRLLGVLRQPAGDGHAPQPTLADLDALLVTFRAAGLEVEMSVTGRPFPLLPSAQLAIFRMVQEALTNTLKHAPGASARLVLRYSDDQIELEVTDNGPAKAGAGGSGIGGAVAGSGHGIAGMRERAAVFGGQVSAGQHPGGGWRVQAVLRADADVTDPDAAETECA